MENKLIPTPVCSESIFKTPEEEGKLLATLISNFAPAGDEMNFRHLDSQRWRARALISAQESAVLPAAEGMPQSQKHWVCNSPP